MTVLLLGGMRCLLASCGRHTVSSHVRSFEFAGNRMMQLKQNCVALFSLTALLSAQLNFTMGALLQARGEDLYRMKGILSIRGLPVRVAAGSHMHVTLSCHVCVTLSSLL
jgi:G3E family GTPase